MNFCMADSPESALINPLGELGKCEHVPYDPPFGDVRGGVRDPAILDKWLNSEFEDSCAACELISIPVNRWLPELVGLRRRREGVGVYVLVQRDVAQLLDACSLH